MPERLHIIYISSIDTNEAYSFTSFPRPPIFNVFATSPNEVIPGSLKLQSLVYPPPNHIVSTLQLPTVGNAPQKLHFFTCLKNLDNPF